MEHHKHLKCFLLQEYSFYNMLDNCTSSISNNGWTLSISNLREMSKHLTLKSCTSFNSMNGWTLSISKLRKMFKNWTIWTR